MLIIGGLFALALLAIIGIVLLAMGEQRTQAAKASSPASSEPAIATTPAEEQLSVVQPTSPANVTALSKQDQEQYLPVLNGSFHELAEEIRALHEQAWRLEQRLNVLVKMADHVDASPRHFVHIEEEKSDISQVS